MNTTAGKDYILRVNFAGETQVVDWYIGLISGGLEYEDYDGDRKLWSPQVIDGDQVIGFNQVPFIPTTLATFEAVALYASETKGETSSLKVAEVELLGDLTPGVPLTIRLPVGWR